MKYVLTDAGNIKIGTDGHPMVIDGEKEFSVDAIGAAAKITAITTESNERRKALGEAKTALEAYAGIEDPTAALDALTKVKSYDKDLTTQMDNLKGEINKAWEVKEATWIEEKNGLTEKLFEANVLSNFGTSKVASTLVLTPGIAAKEFRNHFQPDGTAVDAAGNQIYSAAKPGQPAGFDEALQILIDQHPEKDQIVRTQIQSGGGGHNTGGEAPVGQKTSQEQIKAGLAALK